eukprot:12766902-Ditylum_brightwellii.AAC.1
MRLTMCSDDDELESTSSASSNANKNSGSKNRKKKVNTNKVVRTGQQKQVHFEGSFTESTILDSETEWSVIGSSAWSIVKKYIESLSIAAVDGIMKAVSMNLCDNVTAELNSNEQVRLFGMRKGVYSPMLMDDKAVINNHFICEVGW